MISLSALDGVGDEFCELDDDVFIELFGLDKRVELGGKHGLDKVLSIRQNDSTKPH